jgi:hypothetical protein
LISTESSTLAAKSATHFKVLSAVFLPAKTKKNENK